MKAGVYALASLDGAPLDRKDLDVLELADSRRAFQESVTGLAVRLVDSAWAEGSISFFRTPHELVAFLGYLDEPEDLAGTLGLDARTAQAELAIAAVERFGAEAPGRMVGEWSLLRWRMQDRRLTLLSSENCRDVMYFATDGNRVAVASEMLRLTRLPWVGREIDRLGFALSVSRARLRRYRTHETVWKGIFRAAPGTAEVFSLEQRSTVKPVLPPLPAPWADDFDSAVEALDHMGRRILRQHLQRNGRTAFLLSGGLDSTLLTSWGAYGLAEGSGMFCLCSVVPPGSGLPDEREFSGAVAASLGLPIEFVWPPQDWSVYRPSTRTFEFEEAPVMDVRHYLNRALQEAASAGGANGIINGALGERSLTDKTPLPRAEAWPLRFARQARSWLRDRQELGVWPGDAFHVRLSDELLQSLPSEWKDTWNASRPRPERQSLLEPMGIQPVTPGAETFSTLRIGGLRELLPYRDRRLLQLAAGMPKGFSHQLGVTRSLARAMLKGRVPNSVRMRSRGMPFSPDYQIRLVRQAKDAQARLAVFDEAGLDKWIDLKWLANQLQRAVSGAQRTTPEQFALQNTAMTGEFLLWAGV